MGTTAVEWVPDTTTPPAPTAAASLEDVAARLQSVRGLEDTTDAQRLWLAAHGTQVFFADNQPVFMTGETARSMFILLDGEIHVRRVPSGPVSYFVGRAGQMTGKLPYSRMKTYGGDGYAVGQVWGLDIPESEFPELLREVPSMAQLSVSLLLDRVREVTRIEQQSEKLTALGKLAANLSHELNNPASAARSAANNLWTELRTYGDTKYRLGTLQLPPDVRKRYWEWIGTVRPLTTELPERDMPALQTGEREDAFAAWMEAHKVAEPWRFAATLAETRIELSQMDELATILAPEALAIAVASFSAGLKAERMTDTIRDATRRIFELITAIKDYSYMDQAPIQEIDVPAALDNTLAMFGARLTDVEIRRDYSPDTPAINAYGSELNQVWTALIENALDSMDNCENDPHRLTLQTRASGGNVLVEIQDNGPGIDPAIRSRIFEPFFTTKPVGAGLGLGLDAVSRIVLKHRGAVSVESKPGATCFQVRLPIEQAGAY